MTQTQKTHSLSFVNHWLEYLLVLCVLAIVAYCFAQWALPIATAWIAAHSLLVIGSSALLLLGVSAPWTVPAGWRMYKAIHNHKQERLDREAYRALLETTNKMLKDGYNVTLKNSLRGDELVVNNPYVNAKRLAQTTVNEIAEDEKLMIEPPKTPIPTMVRYEDVRNQVPRGHVLVGIGQQGIETKEQAVGACVWIVGLSGTGKTSTTVLRVEERRADGHKFYGADPHWFKPDSLTNAVKAYEKDFLIPMAKTPEETQNVFQAFIAEFNARKSGQRPQPWQKITLLVDEVGAIMDPTTKEEEEIAKTLRTIARICGQEARNFNMGGIFISQQATGLAWLRKVALMVIVHQLLMQSEKELACNGDKVAAKDMETWPRGRTYVYGVGFQEGPRTVQQPFFEKVIDAVPAGANVASRNDQDTQFFTQDEATYREIDTGSLVDNTDWLPERLPDLPNMPGKFPENTENGKPGNGKQYLLSDTEKPIFINLYNRFGSIEESLQTMKKGARYHKDASRLLKEAGLL